MDDERVVIQGIAAFAVSLAEMGSSRDEFNEQVAAMAARHRVGAWHIAAPQTR